MMLIMTQKLQGALERPGAGPEMVEQIAQISPDVGIFPEAFNEKITPQAVSELKANG